MKTYSCWEAGGVDNSALQIGRAGFIYSRIVGKERLLKWFSNLYTKEIREGKSGNEYAKLKKEEGSGDRKHIIRERELPFSCDCAVRSHL